MPWHVTYAQGADQPGVGTATAIYSDFELSAVKVERILDTNDDKDVQAFLSECARAITTATKLRGASADVIAKIEAALNAPPADTAATSDPIPDPQPGKAADAPV